MADAPFDLAPELDVALRLIRRDAAAGRFDSWAWSTVIDENVGAPVIPPDLYRQLHDAADISATFPVGNAGLLHVYGYLFSTVETPYGYKRDRWNDGVLARAVGRPESHFRLGDSDDETPLQRVTGVAMPLLRDPPPHASVLDQIVHDQTVHDQAARDRPGHRETMHPLATRAVVEPSSDGSGVLSYGVDEGDGLRLVTMFPVADAVAFAREAASGEPRLRWNASRPSA